MDLYSTLTRPKRDLQVVPDDGYNSPVHSPYYAESARSPAGSVTSSADSAYDELAEVIPDLKDAENCLDIVSKTYSDMVPKKYSDMSESYSDQDIVNMTYSDILNLQCSTMGPYELYNTAIHDEYLDSSTNMNEAASPHSDSEYAEALSPSGGLMQAVTEEASANRMFPEAQAPTINLCDLWAEEPQKQQAFTEPEAVAAHASLLFAKSNASDQKPMFMMANEDSGICVDSHTPLAHEAPRTENVSALLPNQSLIPDDKDLVKKFSVLAEYLDAKPARKCQQTEPKNMSQSPVNVKVEDSEEIPMDTENDVGKGTTVFAYQSNFDSQQVSNVKIIQWVENVLHSQGSQTSSFSPPTQSTFFSESVVKTTSQTQQQASSQLSVAELCKKVSQRPSSVMFFKAPKETKETVKAPEERKANISITVPIDHEKVFSNWRGPPKTKKPTLHSHSSKPRLYNFLFDLLNDPNARCIEWLNEEQGIFKFINSSEVARLWGQRKNKPNMKYENFARSLRTYVAKGILTKPRNKLVYQFMPNYH